MVNKTENTTGTKAATHEKALDLAEKSLEEFSKGHDEKGEKLAKQADRMDHSAVVEVARDLEEDKGSDPNAAKKVK